MYVTSTISSQNFSLFLSTVILFRVTGHFETSGRNDSKMTLNTKRSMVPYICTSQYLLGSFEIHHSLISYHLLKTYLFRHSWFVSSPSVVCFASAQLHVPLYTDREGEFIFVHVCDEMSLLRAHVEVSRAHMIVITHAREVKKFSFF